MYILTTRDGNIVIDPNPTTKNAVPIPPRAPFEFPIGHPLAPDQITQHSNMRRFRPPMQRPVDMS
ncbi:hypothetical protein I7I50_02273 [Histoplasma capsulatum G186AR]|uniref:Uncharacterized protein n=1 Tax=Ajellomyces capsulatus TaxID=5037 RepID=A0A8H7Z5I6_AJECA|nr:hypothetical protein I7I52_01063 [Histoplasma capsulatum]QSS71442.1 hypothetical protein I7I50_02273 [Histoplasma capsulatum G186AR]